MVEEGDGATFRFERTTDNALVRNAGIVKAEATDAEIGAWWTLLNDRLLEECG